MSYKATRKSEGELIKEVKELLWEGSELEGNCTLLVDQETIKNELWLIYLDSTVDPCLVEGLQAGFQSLLFEHAGIDHLVNSKMVKMDE